MASSPLLPRSIWLLLTAYFCASLAHFAHNAEFIAYYPNMPSWLTREQVYLAWLAVSSFGLAALVFTRLGLPVLGAALLAVYGALGLYGLGHYMLALCSEHTVVTNITIWSEVITGFLLFLSGSVLAKRRFVSGRHALHCRLTLPSS